MVGIKKGKLRRRGDETQIGQALARLLLLRLAALDRVDLSGVECFQPAPPFRRVDFDRAVAEAELSDRDRAVACSRVTVVEGTLSHPAQPQAQYRDGLLLDLHSSRWRCRQQAVMTFRQTLAKTTRSSMSWLRGIFRCRQELAGKLRRQAQLHRSDHPSELVDIDRRLGIERNRSRHEQARNNATLAGLAPLDPPLTRVSPPQRLSFVVEPVGAAGRDDPLQ